MSDDKQLQKMADDLRRACDYIDWLLPYARVKSKESGNTAGLCANASMFSGETRTLLHTLRIMGEITHEAEAGQPHGGEPKA